jgi:hypothetical protein
MALAQRKIRQTTVNDGTATETNREVYDAAAEREHKSNVAERVVWFIAGTLLALLGLRFLFALLGANPNSGIAAFIYGVTYPFVAPFFNLFSYDSATAGASRLEGFTLVAMLIYALIAWGIAKALSIRRP